MASSTSGSGPSATAQGDLFPSVGSSNFLEFEFGGKSYSQQLQEAVQTTGKFSAVTVEIRQLNGMNVVWMTQDFSFMGGSLGCAEGEKLALGFELAHERQIPAIVVCRSGGARMQEGTLSLLQMAKVSVAISALKRRRIPYISVCKDPTYGGVSASYAMQGDVRIAISGARIGFAGPAVILNTVYKMNQTQYDADCPQGFQSAEYLQRHGQVDIIINEESELDGVCAQILDILYKRRLDKERGSLSESAPSRPTFSQVSSPETAHSHSDHTVARKIDRFTAPDIIKRVFTTYVQLEGDGKVGSDSCLKGGIALLDDQPCVVLSNFKGPESNFGMASPHGYRLALRLMDLAQHFEIPVITLVDTVGAYPSFQSEELGQSEALATNLLKMAELTVPLVCLILGEGGSGGALAIAMGNRIGMMERAYYAVISPEGAASILGRYKDEEHKSKQFPQDCRDLAHAQKIFAHNLKDLGVVDVIVPEFGGQTKDDCDKVASEIKSFFLSSLASMAKVDPEHLVSHRYEKFRALGKWKTITSEEIASLNATPRAARPQRSKAVSAGPQSKTLHFIAETTLNSAYSAYLSKKPSGVITPVPLDLAYWPEIDLTKHENAKWVLDNQGVDALVKWVQAKKNVMITDTTMRDAHQSLLATRLRTEDLLAIADETKNALKDAFSLEMWGGATYDVCYRFLHEDPWERLRLLRKKVPNVLFQMLVRGANGVGYKSYPDNVIEQFCFLAAKNGIDVFRIFDCFNDVSQMKVCIDAVRKTGKVAEVAICFTGDFMSPKEKIYTLDYYKDLTKQIVEAGAHMIAVKDMAGLLKPQAAAPLMAAIRSVTDLPVHFHSHNTSSASLATCINMAANGCDIVDLAVASMADTTSQPSLNAFLASMEGHPQDPKIPYLSIERLDQYWSQVRTMYQHFESGLKCGTARVYEHQIPGGQYSNLYAQCSSLGIMHRWNEVLDMYRDVNLLFGDIVKVTPSSKCVGDMALYLIKNNLTCEDVLTRGESINFPESVVELFMGELGFPHMGFPEAVSKAVLKGRKPLTERPGAVLPPADFEAERVSLQTKYSLPMSDEDVISALLYPKVFDEYIANRNKFGWKITWLDSQTYFFGMMLDQAITVSYPDDGKSLDQCKPHSITLKRVGPLTGDGARIFEFIVDGERRKARVVDKAIAAANFKTRKADTSDPKQVPSPLPGTVEVVFVGEGSEVRRKDPIMMITAMKMEVQVVAPHDGKITELPVKVGDRIDIGSLLAIVVPK